MSGKIIEINCSQSLVDTLTPISEINVVTLLSVSKFTGENPRATLRLFVEEQHIQETLDKVQSILTTDSGALILLLPVDTQVGDDNTLINSEVEQVAATREELFFEISKGTECNANFILLVLLSTIVAAIGLSENNIAVVIGAMVIAPLLGPNLGLALGAALGDKGLIKAAIFTNAVGVTLTIGLSALLTLFWTPELNNTEILSRTEVQLSSIIIAIAAGIAAVQSLTTRLTNLLVGVMVAVALVPPATVLGLTLGMQEWSLAIGAAVLLLVNISAVNLSAQIVFLIRGIRPRTWLEQRKAQQATWINIAVWIVLLIVCVVSIGLLSQT